MVATQDRLLEECWNCRFGCFEPNIDKGFCNARPKTHRGFPEIEREEGCGGWKVIKCSQCKYGDPLTDKERRDIGDPSFTYRCLLDFDFDTGEMTWSGDGCWLSRMGERK